MEGTRGRGLSSIDTFETATPGIRGVRERTAVALLAARLNIFLGDSILLRPGEKESESPDELQVVSGGEGSKDGDPLTVTARKRLSSLMFA